MVKCVVTSTNAVNSYTSLITSILRNITRQSCGSARLPSIYFYCSSALLAQ